MSGQEEGRGSSVATTPSSASMENRDSQTNRNVQELNQHSFPSGQFNSHLTTESRNRASSLHVARIIPSRNSNLIVTGGSPDVLQETNTDSYGNSDTLNTVSDESGDGNGIEIIGDHDVHDDSDGRQHFDRANHRSFRLNTLEALTQTQSGVRVIPNYYTSFHLRDGEEASSPEDDEPFTFLSPELEPNIPREQRKRATKAIKQVVHLTSKEPTSKEVKKPVGCCDGLKCHCLKRRVAIEDEDTSSTEITPEMQKASNQGWGMLKHILFPALPAVLQDVWVLLEVLILFTAFFLGVVEFSRMETFTGFDVFFFVLSLVDVTLAFIDAFIYFFQLGRFAKGVRYIYRKLTGRENEDDLLTEKDKNNEEENKVEKKKCCRFSKKWKDRFNSWFELARNILSELLLYPLLINDIIGFITEAGYETENDPEKARDFGLFVIGGFYLILAVYIMRIFMIAGSMVSLIRIPVDKNSVTHGNSDKMIPIRFCVHVIMQILVHLMVILVIAAKVNYEHEHLSIKMTIANSTELSLPQNASPFLFAAILLGDVLPIAGVFTFIVVNYYWMKEFSIGFWLNMMSLLQGESFAETVFSGEALSMTKEKASDFVKKAQLKKVKKQLKRFKKPSFLTKFFFPVRVPLMAISSLIYNIVLVSFIACLMLTYEDGSIKVIIFSDDNLMTAVFLLSVLTFILANIHLLILVNLTLLVGLIFLAITALITLILMPLIVFVYLPSMALLGYCLSCIQPRSLTRASPKERKEIEGVVFKNSSILDDYSGGNKEFLEMDIKDQIS